MYGAIIGDIVGSTYEFNNVKTKDFTLFPEGCNFTDDTIMTFAVAKALFRAREEQVSFKAVLVEEMQRLGREYPHPLGAYGYRFGCWLRSNDPQPYNSFGNGSAMRVSPCGLIAVTLQEALDLAKASAEVTHNHPEGIKGAQAVSAAIFMAKCHLSKEEIRAYIQENFYPMDRSFKEIRRDYAFNESCQETVPEAITAFLESESFEDAIRNAIYLGGDSDTIGAITGAIAWSYYYNRNFCRPTEDMQRMREQAEEYLPEDFREFAQLFHELCVYRAGAYDRIGIVRSIPL